MSLDYDLRIATDLATEQTLEILANELKLEWEEGCRLVGSGIVVGAMPEREQGQVIIQQAFGFKPTVNLWFWLDSNQDYPQGKHSLLIAVISLLRHLPGDAVLLFNSEIVRLQRINGRLIFNQDFSLWSESELAEVELPFDCQPLPSPLLSAPAFR
ncbi:MAG: hypothetical protein Fur0025_39180 [Oscillatoriaceae cyanobacterium]